MLQIPQWRAGPYSVCTALKPAVTSSTVGIRVPLTCYKLAIPELRHCGQRRCSSHRSAIGDPISGHPMTSSRIVGGQKRTLDQFKLGHAVLLAWKDDE